jgi:hypothetical protein
MSINQLVGKRVLEIKGVDDEGIQFKWGVVSNGVLHRANLERLVELLESGAIRANAVTITSDYRTLVSDERPTTAVAVVRDLGYFNPEED